MKEKLDGSILVKKVPVSGGDLFFLAQHGSNVDVLAGNTKEQNNLYQQEDDLHGHGRSESVCAWRRNSRHGNINQGTRTTLFHQESCVYETVHGKR